MYLRLLLGTIILALSLASPIFAKEFSCSLKPLFPESQKVLPGPKSYFLLRAKKGKDLSDLEEIPIFELRVTDNRGSAKLITSSKTIKMKGVTLKNAERFWGPLRHVVSRKTELNEWHVLLKESESKTTFLIVLWFDHDRLRQFQAIGWSLGSTSKMDADANDK